MLYVHHHRHSSETDEANYSWLHQSHHCDRGIGMWPRKRSIQFELESFHHTALKHLNLLLAHPFVQQSVHVKNKENAKLYITGPLWWESTGHRWIPLTKGQWSGQRFHVAFTSYQAQTSTTVLPKTVLSRPEPTRQMWSTPGLHSVVRHKCSPQSQATLWFWTAVCPPVTPMVGYKHLW